MILPIEFNIKSVEIYKRNELGQPTWKIDSSFDCIIFGNNGSTKRQRWRAIIAVLY
jgi:hypothetical protein